MNFFILDCVFLATYRSRKNGVGNPAPESWILDFRILRFGSRQVLSFSFAHQRQADRGLVDEREFKDRPRILTPDIDVQKCGAIVSKSDDWLLILNCHCGNCERLWASKIGFSYSATSNFTFGDCDGRFWLAVFRTARTARRNLPCQGIVSGNSYLPTKGSRGTQSNIYISLKFWQVWMDSP